MKRELGQFLHEGVVIKKCPDCLGEIKPDMTKAYEEEWCPFCGLNHTTK
ncbi:hypothetical protein [Paenibacillus sp. 1P03SA]